MMLQAIANEKLFDSTFPSKPIRFSIDLAGALKPIKDANAPFEALLNLHCSAKIVRQCGKENWAKTREDLINAFNCGSQICYHRIDRYLPLASKICHDLDAILANDSRVSGANCYAGRAGAISPPHTDLRHSLSVCLLGKKKWFVDTGSTKESLELLPGDGIVINQSHLHSVENGADSISLTVGF